MRNFLDQLGPVERRDLVMMATKRTFPRGSRPMREGDRAEYVMVIIDGWTRISVREGDHDRNITERGPGQLIGEVGALRVSARSATVTVLDTVTALVLRTEDFASYLEAHQRVLDLVDSQIDDRLTEEPYQWDAGHEDLSEPGTAPSLAPLSGENCTVVFTDVVKFGALERSDRDRETVRTAHWDMLQRSLGYLWEKCITIDQGDGLLIVAPPAIPTAAIMERLHRQLPRELRRHNQAHDRATRIRLRVSANVGPVAHDTIGVTGDAIILASRLNDAQELREATASADIYLGMLVSPFVYDTAIKNADGWIGPNAYEPVEVRVKETRMTAWMGLFGAPSDREPR